MTSTQQPGSRQRAARASGPPPGGRAGDSAVFVARVERPRAERPRGELAFLTVAEVAAIMRVSKMTVYRMVHAGELPAVRVGRSFRVPDQAVHDYLQQAYIAAG